MVGDTFDQMINWVEFMSLKAAYKHSPYTWNSLQDRSHWKPGRILEVNLKTSKSY